MKRLLPLLAVAALAVPASAQPPCSPDVDPGAAPRIDRALRAKRDLWGEELLAAQDGPTFDGVRRYLPPLLYAQAAKQMRLTDSGVHYVALLHPSGPQGAGSVVLHVADGSQLISQRADGTTLTVRVGLDGGERYGACVRRLTMPRLRSGWLPVLQTGYVDALGARYRRGYVNELGRQLRASDRGILQRERFSSDIPDSVYGLHSQAVAWQGLRGMGLVWAETGNEALAATCRSLANRLGRGLRAAVRESQVRLADGSLFFPPGCSIGNVPTTI